MFWRGSARLGPAVHGMTWQGLFLAGGGSANGYGPAWRGEAGLGTAGLGMAWQGLFSAGGGFRESLWHGTGWHGQAWHGKAGRGLAGFGEDTFFWRMT